MKDFFSKIDSENKLVTDNQLGQTLVETMVAALVLVIGIGAAVSLAVYGLSATSGVSKQLIGVGLAREGIEAVKNMRDTNWLRSTLEPDCSNFSNNGDDARCYYTWLTGGSYNIDPGGTSFYTLGFDANNPQESSYWSLVQTNSRFGLNYTPETPELGLYSTGGGSVPVSQATSGFARKITLTTDNSFPPFDQSTGPRLKVKVEVWWEGKRCPKLDVNPPDNLSCKVTLETYLTNWKDY